MNTMLRTVRALPLIVCGVLLTRITATLHGPLNTVQLAGGRTTMSCHSSPPDFEIEWYHEKPSRRSLKLTNETRNNSSVNAFTINTAVGIDLIIDSVQLQDAGRYQCSVLNKTDGTTWHAGANLSVLDTNPNCSVENATVTEYDNIVLECTFSYNGCWTPVIEWILLDDQTEKALNYSTFANSSKLEVGYSVVSIVRINAEPEHHNRQFLSKVRFRSECKNVAESNRMTFANNIPDYKFSWSSPEIQVLYGPRQVTINPSRDVFHPGDYLSCSATANPESEYKWLNIQTNATTVGTKLQIEHSMIREEPYIFRCIAQNRLSENSSARIKFVVNKRHLTDPMYLINIITGSVCILLTVTATAVAVQIVKGRRKASSYNISASYKQMEQNGMEQNGGTAVYESAATNNSDPFGDYVDLQDVDYARRGLNHGNSSIAFSQQGAPAEAAATASNIIEVEENRARYFGADGTEYAELNRFPAVSTVHHPSHFSLSEYASIDHTRKPPRPRK